MFELAKNNTGKIIEAISTDIRNMSLEDTLQVGIEGIGSRQLSEEESELTYAIRYQNGTARGINSFTTYRTTAQEHYFMAAANYLETALKRDDVEILPDISSRILRIKLNQKEQTYAEKDFSDIHQKITRTINSPFITAILNRTDIETRGDIITFHFPNSFSKGRFEKKAGKITQTMFPEKELVYKTR
jgi:hypothetical protein